MTLPVKNEQNKLNAAISGKLAHDTRALEQVFESCRTDEKKMTLLVRAFSESYLIDQHRRPLKLRPLQETIVVKCLTYPDMDTGKHRKLAILAPEAQVNPMLSR